MQGLNSTREFATKNYFFSYAYFIYYNLFIAGIKIES
jgi:hypothetical protein